MSGARTAPVTQRGALSKARPAGGTHQGAWHSLRGAPLPDAQEAVRGENAGANLLCSAGLRGLGPSPPLSVPSVSLPEPGPMMARTLHSLGRKVRVYRCTSQARSSAQDDGCSDSVTSAPGALPQRDVLLPGGTGLAEGKLKFVGTSYSWPCMWGDRPPRGTSTCSPGSFPRVTSN